MLAGKEVAKSSNDLNGCTFESQGYPITMPDGSQITIWDTAGLDEGSDGQVPALQAMKNLRDLTTKLANSTGLSLVIYVLKGRINKTTKVNYTIFKAFCEEVPLVIVVTGLEDASNKDEWWTKNKQAVENAGLRNQGHACIVARKTTTDPAMYEESKQKVQKLISDHSLEDPWKADQDNWFIQTLIRIIKLLLPNRREQWEVAYQAMTENGITEEQAEQAARNLKPNKFNTKQLWRRYIL